jgi:D-alanyl-D-alanine endopeptidase (penicillin-binding protein 7)
MPLTLSAPRVSQLLAMLAAAVCLFTLPPAAQAQASGSQRADRSNKPAQGAQAAPGSRSKPGAQPQAKARPKARPPVQSKSSKRRAAALAAAGGAAALAARPSFGQQAGLHATRDDLELRSSVALVIDQETQEVLFQKNQSAVLPIASLTKLMTGLIISEARLPLDEVITITQDDVDTEKGSGSRLRVGTTLTRDEALHLALMSSENRAAHALGRTYPGGLAAFVSAMNTKARLLGMTSSTFVEPTGLSSRNQSSARDLAVLVNVASADPLLRDYSTSTGAQVAVGNRTLKYNNTNRLVRHPEWEIGLQKTGYISEAGQCLVMQARVAGRKLIMVFLDSAGKLSRIGDAERVRRWVENNAHTLTPLGPAPLRTSSAYPGVSS